MPLSRSQEDLSILMQYTYKQLHVISIVINMKRSLLESFEWMKNTNNLDTSRLIKVTAKTTQDTFHPFDKIHPKRVFTPEELKLASRSLIGREVWLNHKETGGHRIPDSVVVDSEWANGAVEAQIYTTRNIINMIRKGKINECSIEFSWRNVKKVDGKSMFEGLWFPAIALLDENAPPAGDSNTKVLLYESQDNKGKLIMKLNESKVLGEPMDRFANWEACMTWAKGEPSIDNPEEYCGSLKAKEQVVEEPVTVEEEVEEATEEITEIVKEVIPEVTPEEVAEIEEKVEPVVEEVVVPEEAVEQNNDNDNNNNDDNDNQSDPMEQMVDDVIIGVAPDISDEDRKRMCKKICENFRRDFKGSTELKESLVRVLKVNKGLKETLNKKVEQEVKDAKEKFIKKVESVIPKQFTIRQFTPSTQRLVQELKKIVRESKKGE